MKKRFNSNLYTKGKFGHRIREIVDTDNENLYAHGTYPTKIKEEDLPEYYIKINSRAIWYMDGYVKMNGVVDIDYKYLEINHMFKDDYLFISYKEPLRWEKSRYGFYDCVNYDICVCGYDIINLVLAAEKYSGLDTNKVRQKIEEKRIWYRDNKPEDYAYEVGEDCDIFDLWKRRGYIDKKLLK